ncbi:MAG: hypothetical protein Q9186_002016 [Xanthomendoza sp. 1 TL-2023]
MKLGGRVRAIVIRERLADGHGPEGLTLDAARAQYKVFDPDMEESREDMLFATLNNIGSQNFEKSGCKPSVIMIERSVVGDHKQLWPTIIAKENYAASENSIILPLAMQDINNANLTFLDTQYRMAPSIASSLSMEFYGDFLKNHPMAEGDNVFC